MRNQQQAFRVYYASMTDAELLAIHQNRGSFISAAQSALAEELARRQLKPPSEPPPESSPSPVQPERTHAAGKTSGASEEQVSMVGTVPERVNAHGVKIEDLAGTGEHDSLGG